MPRLARSVFAHMPHHITQRGNRREDVFFNDEDRQFYLDLLQEYAAAHHVEVAAYCLMTNHIHLILIPSTEDGLQKVLKPLHMRYAQRLNRARAQQGHVWQGRYFSAVLDGDYLRAALRYVERNPVRARLVRKAENYAWSSAKGHCSVAPDTLLRLHSKWRKDLEDISNWSKWLAEPDEEQALLVLRRNTMMGLPCGSEKFIRKIEKRSGRNLHYKPQGRPKKVDDNAKAKK
jgi:putative transposase